MRCGPEAEEGETIRALTPDDAEQYWQHRMEAIVEAPFAFGVSAEEHRATTIAEVAERLRPEWPRSFFLGLFAGERLVGVARFVRETSAKERHKGHIYGVAVSPSYRGRGAGFRLLRRLLDDVGQDPSLEQVLLAARAGELEAGRLYRRLGFVPFGVEPRALKVGDEYIDEEHMILRLR